MSNEHQPGSPFDRKEEKGSVEDVTQARYLTDDRDSANPLELVIFPGGNGDWYIGVAPPGEGIIGRSVRICTSGGASSAVPGLAPAIADAFRSLLRAGHDPRRGITLVRG